jgi:2-dehydropantoate 2-reductase
VIAGATTVGAEVLGPGRVRIVPSTAAARSLTSLALPPAGDPRRAAVERFAATLEAAGLPTDAREDVGAVVWRKLALTASIGPLCAVLRCDVAEALAEPEAVAATRQVFDEVVAVGARGGVALDADELWAHARETWAGIGPHRPSIAVDVDEGRRTEIDALCGEVVRRGAALGVPTPATELVHAAVAALDPAGSAG